MVQVNPINYICSEIVRTTGLNVKCIRDEAGNIRFISNHTYSRSIPLKNITSRKELNYWMTMVKLDLTTPFIQFN